MFRILSKVAVPSVIVSALGFFVDLYDIIIFSAERVDSFRSLGIPEEEWTSLGGRILSMQMAGMLIGGFLWGWVGDRFGRVRVLFGSILTYSVFSGLNAWVTGADAYMWCRFLAGVGLAGELGAGITLVAEQVDKRYRGFAVAMIGGLGMLGAVTAGIVANLFEWKTSYLIGAGLGLLLLLMRMRVAESGLYDRMAVQSVRRGDVRLLFRKRESLLIYACILLVGMPAWFSNGVLLTFTREISGAMGMTDMPSSATAISFYFTGFAFGDPCCGLLSQRLQSRKKAIAAFLILYALSIVGFFTLGRQSVTAYYALFTAMGFSVGFTIMLFTLAAEQFGTDLRSFVTTSTLNLNRAWVIPLTAAFSGLAGWLSGDYLLSAAILAGLVILLAFLALRKLKETFHSDLDFTQG